MNIIDQICKRIAGLGARQPFMAGVKRRRSMQPDSLIEFLPGVDVHMTAGALTRDSLFDSDLWKEREAHLDLVTDWHRRWHAAYAARHGDGIDPLMIVRGLDEAAIERLQQEAISTPTGSSAAPPLTAHRARFAAAIEATARLADSTGSDSGPPGTSAP